MAGPGTELATAWVRLVPSMDGATGQIVKELGGVDTSKVGKSVGGQFAGYVGSGIKAAATTAVSAGAAALGTALVKGFGRLNALDQATQKLQGLGHSADTVDLIMKNALASVKGTAFRLDAAATVAASAVAAGIKPGADLERTLKLVADAATIAGVDMGSMGAIFNKVAASNKVQMDVINQLHEAGVPALSALASYMGVTAEEASKMASAGKIDFETFQAAMEAALGGAALSSGNTFKGAMDNVLASLGRVGAGILGGVFPKLAPLFQSITSALGPVEDKASAFGQVIGDKVAPVIDWLTRALDGGLGKLSVAPQILGPATAAFVALGSSGLAPLVRMVPGLGGFASKLAFLGGPVGIATAAFLGLIAVSPELQAALGTLLSALSEAGAALAPILGEVATALGTALVGAIQVATPVIAGIVQAVAGLISWFVQSEDRVRGLATVVTLAVASWLGYKAVVAGISLAGFIADAYRAVAAFAAMTIAKGKDLAITVALGAMYAKDFVVGLAQTVVKVAASTAAWIANTAALVASRAAIVAATVAQWAFNVALNANPIGIIVMAIAALVGALVWFFTQTDLGRAIWEEFTRFLGEAWENVVSFVTTVWEGFTTWLTSAIEGFASWWNGLWTGIGDFFSGLWEGVVSFVRSVIDGYVQWAYGVVTGFANWWNGLWTGIGDFFSGLWEGVVSFVRSVIQGYVTWAIGVVSGFVNWWNGIWSGLGNFFRGLWEGIVSFVRTYIQNVQNVLVSVGSAIANWWNGLWNGVANFFRGLWDGIVNVVRGAGQALGNVFSGIRDAVSWAFNGLVDIVKAPINGIIGLVNNAIWALNRMRVTIPDWVPFVGGQTWGINLPTIPMLAKGATVLPRPGGTLAILAEAGRPEAVVDEGLLNRALEEGLAGNKQPAGTVVQGPLLNVEHMTVDSDSRVEEVARALWDRASRSDRAQGRVNLSGAVIE